MTGSKKQKRPKIGILFLVIHLLVPLESASSSLPLSSRKYDDLIKHSAKVWLPQYTDIFGFELFKALIYQESRFDPNAVSSVGAKGHGQFMPKTWNEVAAKLNYPLNTSPFDAEKNIYASAYYLSKQIAKWTAPRPMSDRFSLGAASYNAGFSNIYRAQILCNYPSAYSEIILCLPAVTGSHSDETIEYVRNIWGYWMRLKLEI